MNVSLQTAQLAKEKGFDEYVWDYYSNGKFIYGSLDNGLTKWNSDSEYSRSDVFAAPEQYELQAWLRDRGIHIELIVDGWGNDLDVEPENLGYRAFVWQVGQPKPFHNDDLGMSDYETILEIALNEGLKRL